MARATSRGRPMPQTDAFILLGNVHRLSFRADGITCVQMWGRGAFDSDMGYAGAPIVKWTSAPPQLFWSKKAKALYIFPKKNPVKGWKKGVPAHAVKDAKLFGEWNRHANLNDRSTDVDFPEPRLFKAGRAHDIVYRSKKWDGKSEDYHHDFSGPSLYAAEGLKPTAFVVQGGRLTVNDRGIIF